MADDDVGTTPEWLRGWYPSFEPNPGAELRAARHEIERLRAEVAEQCRLNGMGGERELKWMARAEKAERELAELRQQRDDLIADLATAQRERSVEAEHLAQVMVKRDEAIAQRDDFDAELAALRDRFEKAPVAEPDGGWIDVAVPDSWNGNRVRLVRED